MPLWPIFLSALESVLVPLLAVWEARGARPKLYNVLDTWKERASNVTGKEMHSGHFIAWEVPDLLLAVRIIF